jgi:hypothetical protein
LSVCLRKEEPVSSNFETEKSNSTTEGEDLPVDHLPHLTVEIARTRFEEAKQLFAERKKKETHARLTSKR